LVGASIRPALHHFVPLADQLLDVAAKAGEGAKERGDKVFVAFAIHRGGSAGNVEGVVGSHDLICDGQVPRIDHLFCPPTEKGLVLFGHNGFLSLALPARNDVTGSIPARLAKLYSPNVGEETLYEKALGGFLRVILGSATLQEKSVCASYQQFVRSSG
jgi:hypothetical protein